jgi:putative membrane-bound dehydrogenase-like protein
MHDVTGKSESEPIGRVKILEDTDGDGRFDKSTVFADKITYAEGILWHDGAIYAVAPPSLWRLREPAGKGAAVTREELLTGFHFNGFGNDLHGPALGPDGRLYLSVGMFGASDEIRRPGGPVLIRHEGPRVYRCRDDGRDVEAFSAAMGNPVGVAFTAEGEPLVCGTFFAGPPEFKDSTLRDAIIHAVEGGVYPIRGRGRTETYRTGENLPPVAHIGPASPAGMTRCRSGGLGPEYAGNLLMAAFGMRSIQRHILERKGASFQSRKEDFLVSTSSDFHPTDVIEDADGSILIVDTGQWYDVCPHQSGRNLPPVKGGIYRIRRKGAPVVRDPRGLSLPWDRLSSQELAALLDDSRFAVVDRSLNQLARQGAAAVGSLREIAACGPTVQIRRNAVWALTRIEGEEARAAIRLALSDKETVVRLAAAQAVGLHRDVQAQTRLTELLRQDSDFAIRREAATALGRLGRAEAVSALLDGARLGTDPFLEHALVYALLRIHAREETLRGLQDPHPAVRRISLLALDQMEGGGLTRELVAPHLDSSDPALQQAAARIVVSRPGWSSGILGLARQWLSEADLDEVRQESLRGMITAFCKDPAVQDLVASALRGEKATPATRLLLLEAAARAPLDKPPSIWTAEFRWSLERPEENVVRQAIAAIRSTGVNELDDALLKLARRKELSLDVRVEALAAVAGRLSELDSDLLQLLTGCLTTDHPPLLRLTAASAIGSSSLSSRQLEALIPEISKAGPLELPRLVGAFERSRIEGVAGKLVEALTRSPAVESVSPESFDRVLRSCSAEVRGKAQPVLARLQGDRKQMVARLKELEPVLSGGNPTRGRDVFFENKVGCTACHTIQGRGGRVGPDLSRIGATRTAPEILESIVYPSAQFARGYESYLIRTQAGAVHGGIITRETAEAVFLHDAERTERRIPRTSIEVIQQSRVSIMPQGLEAQLNRTELADLVAFLASLK